MCTKSRRDLFDSRTVPTYLVLNNMDVVKLLLVIVCLNMVELQVIKVYSTFQTVFHLKTIRSADRSAEWKYSSFERVNCWIAVRDGKGQTYIHKTLPSAYQVDILADSCPSKQNVVFHNIVNSEKVHATLCKLTVTFVS